MRKRCVSCGTEKEVDFQHPPNTKRSGFYFDSCWECFTDKQRQRQRKVRATDRASRSLGEDLARHINSAWRTR